MNQEITTDTVNLHYIYRTTRSRQLAKNLIYTTRLVVQLIKKEKSTITCIISHG